MGEEPLSDWAKRRDAKIGRLRASPITPQGGPKGAHVNPDAPRAIEQWNGHSWEISSYAPNLREAQRLLHPQPIQEPKAPKDHAPQVLGSGTGKHRKPHSPR
ncbi:DUF6087 family protein [Streptomyces sp. NPDC005132]|uniref:DUF6087 family protein n=1 Tax=Streptomyces sp. NPDC005132 TaxID=3154294 RepID=UPI0033A113C0